MVIHGIEAAAPEPIVTVFGIGAETKLGKILSAIPAGIDTAKEIGDFFARRAVDSSYEAGAGSDCSSMDQALARMFCDLFCVRDAVKQGDAAILKTLEVAVQTINSNLQALFDFYFTQYPGSSLLEERAEIVNGITRIIF